ncbi:MAG: type II toxin-antitoxin system HicA family toxin [Clostridia bacterium]|nr:type II toxin-antitoxin system HicA family toxin [Clostridia bacterium]
MSQIDKLIYSVMRGNQDNNINFNDLRHILKFLGFGERIRGDHYIYTKDGIDEIINIQPIGAKAKPYQVKQIRNIILKYSLGGSENV